MHAKCLEQCLRLPTCSFQVSFSGSISSISQMCWSLWSIFPWCLREGRKGNITQATILGAALKIVFPTHEWRKLELLNQEKRRLGWLAYWYKLPMVITGQMKLDCSLWPERLELGWEWEQWGYQSRTPWGLGDGERQAFSHILCLTPLWST